MTMTGGVIDGCNGKDGGGIHSYKSCQLTITGGTIKNCSSSGSGGGLMNCGNTTISGGTITGNRAEIHGGGIYCDDYVNMSGNPVIMNNKVKNHKENLYIDEWEQVSVKGAFTEGASIGITPYEITRQLVYNFDTYNPGLDPNAVFSSDIPGYSFYVFGTTNWVLLTPQDPQTYITDVMVVGADDDADADYYYRVYVNQGWTGIREDLNNNAGGHYIYLLYKTNRSTGSSGRAISDFYLRVSGQYDAPGSFVRNGRTYYMAEYHGDSEFREKRGDLNCEAGGYWIHLYYTKDDGEYMGVNNLTINNSSGGFGRKRRRHALRPEQGCWRRRHLHAPQQNHHQ